MKRPSKLFWFGSFVLGAIYVAFLYSGGNSCRQTCVAGHLIIEASKMQKEVNLKSDESAIFPMQKFNGSHIEFSYLGERGEIFLGNFSEGVAVVYEPILKSAGTQWKCSIYPKNLKPLLANEKCVS